MTSTTTDVSIQGCQLISPKPIPSLGRLSLSADAANFRPNGKSESTIQLCSRAEVKEAQWQQMGPKAALTLLLMPEPTDREEDDIINGGTAVDGDDITAHDELPVKGTPRMVRIANLSRTDETEIAKFLSHVWDTPLKRRDWSGHGLNLGRLELDRDSRLLTLLSSTDGEDGGGDAFVTMEFPLLNVSQIAVPNKNELEIQYLTGRPTGNGSTTNEESTTGGEGFELVTARFCIPTDEIGNDTTDLVARRVNAIANVADQVNDVMICELSEELCPFLSPRGKYRIEIYKDLFRMRGKTYDFKVLKSSIQQLFLLEKPEQDARHKFLVISLDVPIRQGQTRYQHLVMQIENEEGVVNVLLTEEEIAKEYPSSDPSAPPLLTPEMSGMFPEQVAKVFKVFSGKKVFVASDTFVSGAYKDHQARAVRCSYKTNAGYLYPLKRSLAFLHKPVIFIKYDSIKEIEFLRQGQGSEAKTWDLQVTTKTTASDPNGQVYTFTAIGREEYKPMLEFFDKNTGNVHIRDKKNLLEELAKGGPFLTGRDKAKQGTILDDLGSDDDDEDHDSEDDADSSVKSGGGGGDGGESSDDDGSSEDSSGDDNSSAAELVDMDPDELKALDGGDGGDGENVGRGKKRKRTSGEDGEGKRKRKSKEDREGGGGGKKGKKKDPNAPKKNKSGFDFFKLEQLPIIKAEGSVTGFGPLMTKVAEMWKALSDDEKAPYVKRATEDKARYDEEMKSYVPPVDEGDGGKRKRAKKDKNAPKKNKSGFDFFKLEQLPIVKAEGSVTGFGPLMSKMSEMWKALSDEEKAPYMKKAADDKLRYDEEMKTYVPSAAGGGSAAAPRKKKATAGGAGGAGGGKKGSSKGKKLEAVAAGLGTSSSDDSSDDDDDDDDNPVAARTTTTTATNNAEAVDGESSPDDEEEDDEE